MTEPLCRFVMHQDSYETLMEFSEFENTVEQPFPEHFPGQWPSKATTVRTRRSQSASIIDSLLFEIYDKLNFGRRFSEDSDAYTEYSTMSESVSGDPAIHSLLHFSPESESAGNCEVDYRFVSAQERCEVSNRRRLRLKRSILESKDLLELQQIKCHYQKSVNQIANELLRQLKRKDKSTNKRDRNYDVITAILQAASLKRSVDTRIRFSLEPFPGESGFAQWHDAMRMVARLPAGIPYEFRKRLWLTMANKHIQHRKVDWEKIKRFCFNDRSNPDDNELGVQIVKDLHRTGCSLFCGADAEHNQAVLKRVLLAYARWNKSVGYCQGFNMLAALILEVVEWKEEDALKVMIYLIEGVLPESYFANNLRGLSVDMAVFRDLLRMKLLPLSRHLDYLQMEARDTTSGTIYEPPLTNVFTMQWFLTIFCNCLPKNSVFRVWDLMFLEGNEVILRTALAIWEGLASRIMTVESADEFYSIMGVLTRETMEFGIMDANYLIKIVCTLAPFPYPQVAELRDKYTYNITPFTSSPATMTVAKKGFKLLYSDDEEEDEEQLAAAAWCFSPVFPPQLSPVAKKDGGPSSNSLSPSSSSQNFSSIGPGAFGPQSQQSVDQATKVAPNTERMTLDISSLKKQYAKLRERQKQAHVILKAATMQQQAKEVTKSALSKPHSTATNHLLLGKKALVSKKKERSPIGSSSSQTSAASSKQMSFKFKPDTAHPTTTKRSNSHPAKSELKLKVITENNSEKFRRSSLPIIRSKNENKTPETSKRGKKSRIIENSQDEDGSSSTSTKLCPEDAGKLEDLESDLENNNDELRVVNSGSKMIKSATSSAASSTEISNWNVKENVSETTNYKSFVAVGRLYHSENNNLNSQLNNETLASGFWRKTDSDCVNNNSKGKRGELLTKVKSHKKTLENVDVDISRPRHSSSDEFYSMSSSDEDSQTEDCQSGNHANARHDNDNNSYAWPNSCNYFDQEFQKALKRPSEINCLTSRKQSADSDVSSVFENTTSMTASNTKSVNNSETTASKTGSSPKVLFNPFPVARRSLLRGNSEIGVKLGLYGPTQVTSQIRRKHRSTP